MTVQTLILFGAIIAAVALVGWLALQRRQSDGLPARFAAEDERTARYALDPADVEAELQSRRERVSELAIRPLSRATHHRFSEEWASVQAQFADDPEKAVEQADGLIGDVMRARGYPVGDFELRAADVSVQHPAVVEHYREAHAIAIAHRRGDGGDTEALRRAFAHYRALFADVLQGPVQSRADRSVTRRRTAS